jgi:hypothetical protein
VTWRFAKTTDDGDRVAPLREEIRRAGRNTGRTRLILVWSLVGTAIGVVVHALVAIAPDPGSPVPFELGVALCFGVGFTFLIALPVALLFRLWCVSAMRRRLAPLPPEARTAVLLSLPPDASEDTRNIAESLLREFGVPSELAPAAAPEARGDEASPAEESP